MKSKNNQFIILHEPEDKEILIDSTLIAYAKSFEVPFLKEAKTCLLIAGDILYIKETVLEIDKIIKKVQ